MHDASFEEDESILIVEDIMHQFGQERQRGEVAADVSDPGSEMHFEEFEDGGFEQAGGA